MRIKPVKQHLRKGQTSPGAWVLIDHPAIKELLAAGDFEWITLDSAQRQFDELHGYPVQHTKYALLN